MKYPKSFKIQCEADCERVAKVFTSWLEIDSPQLQRPQTILAPTEEWATLFSYIYADEIENQNLEVEAEKNIIQVSFNIVNKRADKLKDLTKQDLLDLLQDFLENNILDEESDDNEDDD